MKKTQKFIFLIIFLFVFNSFIGCSPKKKNQRYPNQLKPGSAEYLLHEGLFYLNSGNIPLAEKKLLKALKKKPTLIGAVNGLGIVYLQKREFKKAIGYFNQVVRTNPESFDAYNYLGVSYTELGEYNLAKENLLRAALERFRDRACDRIGRRKLFSGYRAKSDEGRPIVSLPKKKYIGMGPFKSAS